MSAHTSGPWQVETRTQRGEFVRATHITTPDGSHLANVGPCNIDANARLIAAAPDLLGALELALATIERLAPSHRGFDSTRGTKDVVCAAIDKATVGAAEGSK